MKKNLALTISLLASLALNVQAQSLTIRENPKAPALDLPLNEFSINDKQYLGKDKVVKIPSFIKGGVLLNDKMKLSLKNIIFKGNKLSSECGVCGGLLFLSGAGSKSGLLNVEISNNAAISNSKEGVETKGAFGGAVYLHEGADIVFRARLGANLVYKGNYACEDDIKKDENGGLVYIDAGKDIDYKFTHRMILSVAETSSITIGDTALPLHDSIASKDIFTRIIKVDTGVCTINSSLEHFLGVLHIREGALTLNNVLGASRILVGGTDNGATFSLRIKDNNALSTKENSSVFIQKDSVFRLFIDEDIFNNTPLSYTLSANENCIIENDGKISTYGAKLAGNTLSLNPIQTLALGADNIVNILPYDRVLVKDLENNKKLILSFSNFSAERNSLSVSELTEESLNNFKKELSSLSKLNNIKIQAFDFKLGSPLEGEESALISMYVGDHNIDASKIIIYYNEDNDWRVLKPKNPSFNGEYITFETNKFGSYAYVVRKTADAL